MRTLSIAVKIAGLLIVSSAIAAAQPLSFAARRDIAATHAPRAIAAADLNGDGWQDLVLGGTGPGTIAVLLNRGIEEGDDGQRFHPPTVIAAGGGPFDLAVGDLNRDGRADIAVANADSNAITLLFGIGRGDFAPRIDLPFDGNPRGIALGDFNRDGRLDIVATKYMGSAIEVLYGGGDGTFPSRRQFAAPPNAQGVAVADFNNDGWPDAVVAGVSGNVAVYLMSASGATRLDLSSAAYGWNVVTTGDFDRDGRQDIALASTGGSVVQLLYGRGSGWTASAAIPVAASPRGITAGDLNRDGRLEIVVAGRSSSTVTVVSRGADGTLTSSEFAAGIGARAVAVADFNNGGGADIATANEYGDSATLLSNTTVPPAAGFAFERRDIPNAHDNRVFGVGDFNHNGIPDIVRANLVLMDGTTPSRTLGQFSSNGGAAGDFNGDGNLDVAYTVSNRLQVFFGDGAGGFADGSITPTSGFGSRLRQADLNRDGRPDLVLTLYTGTGGGAVELWLGQGNGSFTRSARVDGAWNWMDVADLDRDGIVDVVTSSTNGMFAFLGDGQGGVRATQTYGAGAPFYGFDLGDVNSDGIVDLVVADGQVFSWGISWSSRLTVARGNGDGSFETLQQYDTADPGGTYRVLFGVGIGDLNGDGQPDIFTSHADLLAGTGMGDFAPPQRFAGESVGDRVLADVNGDGLLDALGYTVHRPDTGSADVILLNTLRGSNRPPAGLSFPDRIVWPYAQYWADTDENELDAGFGVSDPDMHGIQYRWRLADATVVSSMQWWTPKLAPGTYQVTVTADDERGGVTSDTFTLDVPPFKETVLLPADEGQLHGEWRVVQDSTAAHGQRAWHPNASAPKLIEPLPNPANYLEMGFLADPTQEYKLWIRMKAEDDNWANDSVFVQFTGAKDGAGNPIYEIGTTSALAVNLEECSNCGVSGWGWEDDGWGAINRNGVTLRFPEGGPQTIRIQTREDGVSIDQVVLSSGKYQAARPGVAKNDAVLLEHSGPDLMPRHFQ